MERPEISPTVSEPVVRFGIELEQRGKHHLKGVPGTWRLDRVVS
jgi:hypothetical protein